MELVTNTECKLTNFDSGNQEVPKMIKKHLKHSSSNCGGGGGSSSSKM
jgi:hypothetical protein